MSAAIFSGWSNGQAEGQICKLKLVKRQMYGRGKLDLLQARVIGVDMIQSSPKVRQSQYCAPIDNLDSRAHHRGVYHPRYRRGSLPCRPHPGDEPKAWPDCRECPCAIRTAAPRGPRGRAGLRPIEAPLPGSPARRRPSRRVAAIEPSGSGVTDGVSRNVAFAIGRPPRRSVLAFAREAGRGDAQNPAMSQRRL